MFPPGRARPANEPGTDGIVGPEQDQRDRRSVLLDRTSGSRVGRSDDVHPQLSEIPHEVRPALVAPLRVSMLQHQVLALDIAVLLGSTLFREPDLGRRLAAALLARAGAACLRLAR